LIAFVEGVFDGGVDLGGFDESHVRDVFVCGMDVGLEHFNEELAVSGVLVLGHELEALIGHLCA
jgi:hypothetical protein